jgi:NAD(P) transhydrogenase subunit alpha
MDPIVTALILFTMSVLIGFEVITKVPPILHTPLVVASHAMAAIMVISAIEIAGNAGDELPAQILGGLALLLGVINVVGGYVIADRMLANFKTGKAKAGSGAKGKP